MYCSRCGSKIDLATESYCAGCGTPIEREVDPQRKQLRRFRSLLFQGVGVTMMIVAAGMAVLTGAFLQDAVAADGIIAPAGSGRFVRIDFTTASGERRSYLQRFSTPGNRGGEHVRVLYHPGDVGSEPRLDSFDNLWGAAMAALTMGVGFFLCGRYVADWLDRSRDRRKAA